MLKDTWEKKLVSRNFFVIFILNLFFYFQPFSCGICERPLSSSWTLKKHMQIHESEEKRSHKCIECHRTYLNKESFEDHMRSHTGQQHICEQCGKCFTAAAKLRVSNGCHLISYAK
jgi:uncharacterized Zn-finger protein